MNRCARAAAGRRDGSGGGPRGARRPVRDPGARGVPLPLRMVRGAGSSRPRGSFCDRRRLISAPLWTTTASSAASSRPESSKGRRFLRCPSRPRGSCARGSPSPSWRRPARGSDPAPCRPPAPRSCSPARFQLAGSESWRRSRRGSRATGGTTRKRVATIVVQKTFRLAEMVVALSDLVRERAMLLRSGNRHPRVRGARTTRPSGLNPRTAVPNTASGVGSSGRVPACYLSPREGALAGSRWTRRRQDLSHILCFMSPMPDAGALPVFIIGHSIAPFAPAISM